MRQEYWEHGTIKVPGREWVALKQSVREAHNDYRDACSKFANSAVFWISQLNSAKHNALEAALTEYFDVNHIDMAYFDNVLGLLESAVESPAPFSFVPVTEAMVNKEIGPAATQRSALFTGGPVEWKIIFSDKSKEVSWRVEEAPYAVEKARNHPIPVSFLRHLRNLRYGNRQAAGGYFKGSDPVDDARHLSTVTARFGNAGEAI